MKCECGNEFDGRGLSKCPNCERPIKIIDNTLGYKSKVHTAMDDRKEVLGVSITSGDKELYFKVSDIELIKGLCENVYANVYSLSESSRVAFKKMIDKKNRPPLQPLPFGKRPIGRPKKNPVVEVKDEGHSQNTE